MLIVHHTAKDLFEGTEFSRIGLTLCEKVNLKPISICRAENNAKESRFEAKEPSYIFAKEKFAFFLYNKLQLRIKLC